MTVSELIVELGKFPGDVEVVYRYEDDLGPSEVEVIDLELDTSRTAWCQDKTCRFRVSKNGRRLGHSHALPKCVVLS